MSDCANCSDGTCSDCVITLFVVKDEDLMMEPGDAGQIAAEFTDAECQRSEHHRRCLDLLLGGPIGPLGSGDSQEFRRLTSRRTRCDNFVMEAAFWPLPRRRMLEID